MFPLILKLLFLLYAVTYLLVGIAIVCLIFLVLGFNGLLGKRIQEKLIKLN